MTRAVVHVSPDGVAFIAAWEGLRLVPYNDAVGNATVGVGHLLHYGPVTPHDLVRFRGWTRAGALALLESDLATVEHALQADVVPPLTMPTHFDACASLAFNIGTAAFAASSLCRLLNSGHRGRAAGDAFLKWTYAGGHQLPGLVRRRQAERALWLDGTYEHP